jgi:hypothetical protein
MTIYLIDHADSVGLYSHRNYLEQLPQRIELFKMDLDLVPPHEVGKYREPALTKTTERAKQEMSRWPDMVKPMRKLHHDFALFIRETNRFVSQLEVYQQLKGRQGTRDNLNTLALHLEPISMTGKLGISPTTTASEVVALVRQKLLEFESFFSVKATEMELIRLSVFDVIPRFIDFMNTRIAEHEVKHRRNNQPFSAAVLDQLATARSKVHWSEKQYLYGLQAASNMGTYCSRMAVLLRDARVELDGINGQSNVAKLILIMGLMGARTDEAEQLAIRVKEMLV